MITDIREGLALYLLSRPDADKEAFPALRRGLTFYRNRQFDGPCALRRHIGESHQEGRLRAQGWGIAAFSMEADKGKKKLKQMAKWLELEYPSASGSFLEGLDEMFTFNIRG